MPSEFAVTFAVTNIKTFTTLPEEFRVVFHFLYTHLPFEANP